MQSITYALYDIATTFMAPCGALWLCVHPRYRCLLGRFAPEVPPLDRPPVWVQACSFGEVQAVMPLIESLHKRHAELPVLLSASTVTGRAAARSGKHNALSTWFPFDHRWVVERFVRRARPKLLVLMETELWPNVLRVARRHGVPVALANGRLSERHFVRYARWHRLFRGVFDCLTVAGVQDEVQAERFMRLGVSAERVHATGNIKFEGVRTAVPVEEQAALRREAGFGEHTPVLIFGSTRSGEEAIAARCWSVLRNEFPDLRLVVAPRHPERIHDVLREFTEPVLRRSEVRSGRAPKGERVLIVDTMGELVSFYSIATVAVVGGSFQRRVNGHNPLEPAGLGVPTVFGPHMRDFVDPARVLVECGGAKQLPVGELLPTLRELLGDPDARAAMSTRARDAIARNQGATERTVDLLEPLLSVNPWTG